MAHAFWDNRYAEDGYAYGQEPNDFLVQVLPRLPKGRALCLAEGQGRNAVYLAQQGWDVTAMDQSPVGLQQAQALASQRGTRLTTVVADLSEFRFEPGYYQVVVAIWVHLPPALRFKVHRAAVEALASGGAAVLEAYSPRQLQYKTGGPEQVELLQTVEDLRGDFSGMRVEHLRELTRQVHEGKYHQGESAVVQLLAFKP